MPIAEGDRFKHRITGQLYKVKIFKNGTVILESEDSPHRMWFGDEDVELFFEIAEKGKRKLN